jgi:hypothetical protein
VIKRLSARKCLNWLNWLNTLEGVFLKKWFNWNFAVFFMIKAAPGIESQPTW